MNFFDSHVSTVCVLDPAAPLYGSMAIPQVQNQESENAFVPPYRVVQPLSPFQQKLHQSRATCKASMDPDNECFPPPSPRGMLYVGWWSARILAWDDTRSQFTDDYKFPLEGVFSFSGNFCFFPRETLFVVDDLNWFFLYLFFFCLQPSFVKKAGFFPQTIYTYRVGHVFCMLGSPLKVLPLLSSAEVIVGWAQHCVASMVSGARGLSSIPVNNVMNAL